MSQDADRQLAVDQVASLIYKFVQGGVSFRDAIEGSTSISLDVDVDYDGIPTADISIEVNIDDVHASQEYTAVSESSLNNAALACIAEVEAQCHALCNNVEQALRDLAKIKMAFRTAQDADMLALIRKEIE